MEVYKTLHKIWIDPKTITQKKLRVQLASRTTEELPKTTKWIEVNEIEIDNPKWAGISKGGISIQFEDKECKVEEVYDGVIKLICSGKGKG